MRNDEGGVSEEGKWVRWSLGEMPLLGLRQYWAAAAVRRVRRDSKGSLSAPPGLVASSVPEFRPGDRAAGGSESPTPVGRAIFVPRHGDGSAQPRQSGTQKVSFSLPRFKT